MGGTIDKTENALPWGRRKLAYEIGHHKEGLYVLEVIKGGGELVHELDRRLKVTEGLLRHLIVRVDESRSRPSARAPSAPKSRAAAASRAGCRRIGSRVRDRRATMGMTPATMFDGATWRRNHARSVDQERAARAAAARTRRPATRPAAASGRFFRRRKVCKFCADKIDDINYKDVKLLSGFVPERGKVLPRRISGTCAKHQRGLRIAIVRARQLALLPYASD